MSCGCICARRKKNTVKAAQERWIPSVLQSACHPKLIEVRNASTRGRLWIAALLTNQSSMLFSVQKKSGMESKTGTSYLTIPQPSVRPPWSHCMSLLITYRTTQLHFHLKKSPASLHSQNHIPGSHNVGSFPFIPDTLVNYLQAPKQSWTLPRQHRCQTSLRNSTCNQRIFDLYVKLMAASGPQSRSIKMHTCLIYVILLGAAKSTVISRTTENYSPNPVSQFESSLLHPALPEHRYYPFPAISVNAFFLIIVSSYYERFQIGERFVNAVWLVIWDFLAQTTILGEITPWRSCCKLYVNSP